VLELGEALALGDTEGEGELLGEIPNTSPPLKSSKADALVVLCSSRPM
jgi:hypothetical protein